MPRYKPAKPITDADVGLPPSPKPKIVWYTSEASEQKLTWHDVQNVKTRLRYTERPGSIPEVKVMRQYYLGNFAISFAQQTSKGRWHLFTWQPTDFASAKELEAHILKQLDADPSNGTST